jgi:hypothetical protein
VVDVREPQLGAAAAGNLDHLDEKSVEISRPSSPSSDAASNPVSPVPAPSSRTVSPGCGAELPDQPLAHRAQGLCELRPPALPAGRRHRLPDLSAGAAVLLDVH